MSKEIKSFSDLNLRPWLVRQCASLNITSPSPIQANCIPPILQGKDLIGAAKTGSGKTLAFALPIIEKLLEEPYGIFALVLTPTRELAFQIGQQFNIIGKPMNLKVCVVVGGMDMVQQGYELSNKPHVVIATPGRLADHIESCNTFSLAKVQILVMDEADMLLNGHFKEQLEVIMDQLPQRKQQLYFSATIDQNVTSLQKVLEEQGKQMFIYEQQSDIATVEQLKQQYVLCANYVKDAYLAQVLRVYLDENPKANIMIFTDTCKNCEILSRMLNEVEFTNVALHSMMKQRDRLASLANFKSNKVRTLIATDVASRGLDIPTVELVINHMIPEDPTDYIHRVGRTARAGRGGQALTLIDPNDIELLLAIEKRINVKMTEFKVDDKKVSEIYLQVYNTKSKKRAKLEEENFYEKRMINRRKKWILDGLDPDKEEKKFLKKLKMNKINRSNKTMRKEQKVPADEPETK